jgi:hypothetical protein
VPIPNFSEVELSLIRSELERVWQYIGPDCIDSVSDNDEAVQTCIDADRFTECVQSSEERESGAAAMVVLRREFARCGYADTLAAVARLVYFV